MKIILHGKLRSMFGSEYEISTTVPADAIEGLSRQLPDWPRHMPVDCVGFDTREKLCLPTEETEIHLVPAIAGGGGKWGQIIIGTALIIAGVVLAVTTPGMPWYAIALITTGASMVLGGVMQLFYKTPTLHKSDDPAASKYLGNIGNTTAIGTYRNLAYGRTKIYGHWLSLQVDAKSIVMGRFPTTAPA